MNAFMQLVSKFENVLVKIYFFFILQLITLAVYAMYCVLYNELSMNIAYDTMYNLSVEVPRRQIH